MPLNTHCRLCYVHLFIRPFIHCCTHSVVCLTTGPQPLPKRVLHRLRSSASSFNVQSLFVSLKSSSSCLHLLHCLPVTFIVPSIFSSITCFRRQFLRKFWSIQFAVFAFIVRRIFLPSLIVRNISFFYMITPSDLRPSPEPHFKIFWSTFRNVASSSTIHTCSKMYHFTISSVNLSPVKGI